MASRDLLRFNPALTVAPAQVKGVNIPKGIDPVSQIEERHAAEMSQKFEKMATFAANQQIKTNVAEATKFGAANAPTQEQISLAMENGKPLTAADLPGDITGNVVEQAAAKAALAVAESRSTAAARRGLTQVYVDGINNPDMTPGQLVKSLDDVTVSWAEALKTLDPLSSAKVEASLSTTSTSMLQTYSRTWATNQKIAARSAGIAAIPEHISGAVLALQAGPAETRGAGGEGADAAPVTTKQMIALKKNDMLNQMTLAGNTAAQKKAAATTFDKAITAATSGAVEVYILDQADETSARASYKRLEKAITGKRALDSKHHQSLLKSMSEKEQIDLLDKVRTRATSTISMRSIEESEMDKTAKVLEETASDNFYDALSRGKPDEAKAFLEAMNPKEAFEAKKDLAEGKFNVDVDDEDTVNDIEQMASFVGTPSAKVYAAISNGIRLRNLKVSTATRLRGLASTLRTTRNARALKLLEAETSIDPRAVLALGKNATAEQRRLAAIHKKATAAMILAAEEDALFDPIDWVNTRVAGIAREETERVHKAAVKSLNKNIGLLKADLPELTVETSKDITYLNAMLVKAKKSKPHWMKSKIIDSLEELIDAAGQM